MLVTVGSMVITTAAVYFAVSAHIQMKAMVVPVYKTRVCIVCNLPRDLAAYPTTASKRCIACVQLSEGNTTKQTRPGRQRLWQSQVRRIQCEVRKANPSLPTLGAAECRKLLGVDNYNELWDILAFRLEAGMSEDNYGQWHVDHVSPIAAFDLTRHDHRTRAFHHANLQPMWADANMIKGASLNNSHTPSRPARPKSPARQSTTWTMSQFDLLPKACSRPPPVEDDDQDPPRAPLQ